MKKLLAIFALLASLSAFTSAENLDVGGQKLEIPPPEGYVRVTKDMVAVHRLSLQMPDPANDLVAFYISESDVPVAQQGELPPLERTLVLKVNKKFKSMIVGSDSFSELKGMVRSQNKEMFDLAKSKMKKPLKEFSKEISKEFDVDVAMQVSQILPFDSHYESENAMAYSMYINYGITTEGSNEIFVVSDTTTLLNASGKILLLYCYAPKDEMDWTRSASKSWTESILAGKSPPPSKTSGRSFNWSKVLEKGVSGAVVGGLIGLVLYFVNKKKKG